MDATLIVGLVGLFLTGIGTGIAIQSWRQSRLRPQLDLEPSVQPSSTSAGRVTRAQVRLVVQNTGKGLARNWRLDLEADRQGGGIIKPLHPRDEPPGQSHYQDSSTSAMTFHAQSAEEVIPARAGKSRLLGPFIAELPSGGNLACRFILWAERIKPMDGARGVLIIRPDGSHEVRVS